MALIINTNIQSLNAQRNLSKTLSPLETAMKRLSSGLRINSAKDDAAGLSIATRMSSQVRGLNQAIRNANDAISLVQTTEGAIDEITNALQRVRELAVQSANASNTSVDRGALDLEAQQLLAEVDRIATQTQFNNQTLLDGTLGSKSYQVGAYAGQTISVSITTGLKLTQIGQIAEATGSAVTTNALSNGGMTIAIGDGDAISIGASEDGTGAGQDDYSAYAKAEAIRAAGISGLTVTAQNSVEETTAFADITGAAADDTYTLTVNGVTVYDALNINGVTLTAGDVAAQINLYSSDTGVSASVDATSGKITLSTTDGRNISVQEDFAGTTGLSGVGLDDSIAGEGSAVETRGTITLSATENITLTGSYADIGHSATILRDSTTLSSIDVKSVTNANTTMKRIDSALSAVANLRAELGAINNRFESTISNLSNVVENVTAARSRIMDADFAAETANMTKALILQQAGISILSQANSLPQNVLALLQG
ncbi:MAG: flagellin [Thermodesulfovibrionales bacterium]